MKSINIYYFLLLLFVLRFDLHSIYCKIRDISLLNIYQQCLPIFSFKPNLLFETKIYNRPEPNKKN